MGWYTSHRFETRSRWFSIHGGFATSQLPDEEKGVADAPCRRHECTTYPSHHIFSSRLSTWVLAIPTCCSVSGVPVFLQALRSIHTNMCTSWCHELRPLLPIVYGQPLCPSRCSHLVGWNPQICAVLLRHSQSSEAVFFNLRSRRSETKPE